MGEWHYDSNDSRNDIPLMRSHRSIPVRAAQIYKYSNAANRAMFTDYRIVLIFAIVMITTVQFFSCDGGPQLPVRAGDVIYLKPGPTFNFAHQRWTGTNIIVGRR